MSVLRFRYCHCALACLAMWANAPTLAAEPNAATTAALPAWPDETPSSVYSQLGATAPASAATSDAPAAEPEPVTPARFDAPAVAEPLPSQPVASTSARLQDDDESQHGDSRRLAPRRKRTASGTRGNGAAAALPSFGLPLDSTYTTGAALATVLGLFLLCAGLVRRGAKRATGQLPDEVVSVLGRVPLAARQFAELVRVGNKLVLLSVTSAGAEPLTEITDPAEIDRLVGLCRQGQKGSSTEEFDEVFRQLAKETAPPGFLGHEVPRVGPRLAAPADAFAAYRKGGHRA